MTVQIRLYPNPDGTTNIIVKRTRVTENPSETASNVKPEAFESTLADLIAKVRPAEQLASPV